MYHSISWLTKPKFKPFVVSPALFADHMAYLHRHAYTPITVTHFVQTRTQGEPGNFNLPERPVVLTFDDGFADFFTEALPVLQKYGFTATLYVTTAFINGTSRWLRHENETMRPMLTWKQLAEINAYGIECGAHTHSHPQLDTLSCSLAQDEIVLSKRLLEHHLNQKVCSFAYPFGYHTATVRRLVRTAGYTSACAVKHAMSSEMTDPFALARLMVGADTTIDDFARLLTGRNSSVPERLYTTYARMRTPVWQLVRCSSASLSRYLQGGLSA